MTSTAPQALASTGIEGLDIRELTPAQDSLEPEEQYTMFHPSEVELSDTTKKILSGVERIKPTKGGLTVFPRDAKLPA
jgi:hypothetical protein